MEPPDDELIGQTVNRYSIVALIASGGQGRVYRARDDRLHRDVAIKVLKSDDRGRGTGRSGLIAEARALSLLNHRQVAAVFDYVMDEQRDFLIMEFVPGATLRDILTSGPLPSWEVMRLGAQIARGLAAVHAAHVVHRDIKPANLKITSFGELKILDFGIAKLMPDGAVHDPSTCTPVPLTGCGTVPYMSPEQVRGETTDERSDIFSAGSVVYEMATGCQAFPQRSLAALVDAVQHQKPVPPTLVNPYVHLSLERVITRAMMKEPEQRYQTALDLAESLEALMARPERKDPNHERCLTVGAGVG